MSRDRFLSDEELERFMAVVRTRRHKHQPRDHALFALLANTGIRPSEALALTRADVHLEGRAPSIRVARLKKRTVREIADLHIGPTLVSCMQPHLECVPAEPDARVFALHLRQAERLFHFYASESCMRRGRNLYSLRHTAATRIYRETRDMRLVQSILGHATPSMSAIYAHVTRELLGEAVAAVPPMV